MGYLLPGVDGQIEWGTGYKTLDARHAERLKQWKLYCYSSWMVFFFILLTKSVMQLWRGKGNQLIPSQGWKIIFFPRTKSPSMDKLELLLAKLANGLCTTVIIPLLFFASHRKLLFFFVTGDANHALSQPGLWWFLHLMEATHYYERLPGWSQKNLTLDSKSTQFGSMWPW